MKNHLRIAGLALGIVICAIVASVPPKTQAVSMAPQMSYGGPITPVPLCDPSDPTPCLDCDHQPVPAGCPALTKQSQPKSLPAKPERKK